MIMLPDHPDFWGILHGSIPPGEQAEYYCVSANSGLYFLATEEQATEYVLGGEYDEVLAQDSEEQEWLKQT